MSKKKKENITANVRPTAPSVRSTYTYAPPYAPPFPYFFVMHARYASASFRLAQNIPLIHIQNTAPAPPMRIAFTTPTMLPTPRVPASARLRLLYDPPLSLSVFKKDIGCISEKKRRRKEKYIPPSSIKDGNISSTHKLDICIYILSYLCVQIYEPCVNYMLKASEST